MYLFGSRAEIVDHVQVYLLTASRCTRPVMKFPVGRGWLRYNHETQASCCKLMQAQIELARHCLARRKPPSTYIFLSPIGVELGSISLEGGEMNKLLGPGGAFLYGGPAEGTIIRLQFFSQSQCRYECWIRCCSSEACTVASS